MIKQLLRHSKVIYHQKNCVTFNTVCMVKNLHSKVPYKICIVQENVKTSGFLWPVVKNCLSQIRLFAGEPGSGAGRGGGAGGSIRESGGALGKMGAANEEGYFHNKGKEQLKSLKKKVKRDPGQKSEKGKDE